jgi:hypothetical protein
MKTRELNRHNFLRFSPAEAGNILRSRGDIRDRYDRDTSWGFKTTFIIVYNGDIFEVNMRNGIYQSVWAI